MAGGSGEIHGASAATQVVAGANMHLLGRGSGSACACHCGFLGMATICGVEGKDLCSNMRVVVFIIALCLGLLWGKKN